MKTFISGLKSEFTGHKGELLSVAVHSCLLFCVFGGITSAPKIAPFRLPGTVQGVTTLTYYSPGSNQPLVSDAVSKKAEKTKPEPMAHPAPNAPEIARVAAPAAEQGIGNTAKSGIGEGDITLALQTVFLYPTPDLSKLPHGTKGDVILDAVIDERGKISELTLLKGLGSPVDETVIAAVRHWEYTPAKKNGVPVISEQELHFHYERT